MSTDLGPNGVTDAWIRSSGYFLDSVLAANRAAAAALGFPVSNGSAASEASSAPGAGVTLPEWDVTRSVTDREAIAVGDSIRFEKTLADPDVRSFALASGDTNPLHLDEDFAERTFFGDRIVHGTLISGLISAALARLPGFVVYLSQDLEFRNPVFVGDRVAADCEIVEDLGEYRYRLTTVVTDLDTDETVIDGEAVVLLNEAPDN